MILEIQAHKRMVQITLTIGIACVWFINGLFCKVLHLVPRHEEIVSRILGEEYAPIATKGIGLLELLMVIWIISGIQAKLCASTQMVVVAAMVLLECVLTPDLLLFGRANLIPATLFIGIVYLNGFIIKGAANSKPSRSNMIA